MAAKNSVSAHCHPEERGISLNGFLRLFHLEAIHQTVLIIHLFF